MPNLGALETGADHSEVAHRVVDRGKVVREVMARVEIRVKKFTMASLLLLLETPKIQGMALNGAHLRVKNPFIRDPVNREILAKASDF
jgi:hypothetical protein